MGKKMMEEFLKMKRESKNSLTEDHRNFQFIKDDEQKYPQMSDEEQREMNAKLRKKINHKKMIAMYKNKWLYIDDWVG